MDTSRLTVVAALAAASLLVFTACASPSASPGADTGTDTTLTAVAPGLPDGDVWAQGTVIDDGTAVELCVGGVLESLPPQCSGIPLVDWSWEGVDGSESSGDVTWGAYALQGRYDGESFTATGEPIMLALFDPVRPDDPTNGEPGPADEARLAEVQDDVHAQLGDAALTSYPQNGRLWVQVIWDDGTLQDAADARYGEDVVVVTSALREAG